MEVSRIVRVIDAPAKGRHAGLNGNKRAPAASCLSAARRRAIPSFDGISVSATLNVRGLSLPNQTRVVVRRHLDRLFVSLHRAVVSHLPRT